MRAMDKPTSRALLLATGNAGKVAEFKDLLEPHGFEIKTPYEVGFSGVIEETGTTFRENALLKAEALARFANLPVLSDDSGLEVEALGGEPGLHTARYAGPGATDIQNREKLLNALEGHANRRARFVCVLCYAVPGRTPEFFEGICAGAIAAEEKGERGFGYDPLFIPEGRTESFAESLPAVKDALSHRGRAVQAFLRSFAP